MRNDVTISAFDPKRATASDLGAVHQIERLCHEEANRVEPYRTLADTTAFLRHPPESEPRLYWTASIAETIVGFGKLAVPRGSVVGEVSILVAPEARRLGAGTALFDVIAESAAGFQRTTLHSSYATESGASFASDLGATDTRRDLRSVLLLRDADLIVRAVAGYRLARWNGTTPEHLLDSYAAAREAINDAPAASDQEWHAWDAEKIRDLERAVARRNRQIRVTVALDGDEVVAYSELRVSLGQGAVAGTEDTAVVRNHRGHGLAAWVKAAALGSLREERPDVTLVGTTNAEVNSSMLRINRALGFVPVAAYTTCVIAISGQPLPTTEPPPS